MYRVKPYSLRLCALMTILLSTFLSAEALADKVRYCDGVLTFRAGVQGKRTTSSRSAYRIPARGLIGFSIDGHSTKSRLRGGPNSARRRARHKAKSCLRALARAGSTVPSVCKHAQAKIPFSPITGDRARAIAKQALCKTAYGAGFHSDVVLKVIMTGSTTDKRRNRYCRSRIGVLARFDVTCPPPSCPAGTQRQPNGQCYQFVSPVCPQGSQRHADGRCFKIVNSQ